MILRIYHEFVDRIDNPVMRVTVWHQEAQPCDAKQCPEAQVCLSYPQTIVGFFFLHTSGYQLSNKVSHKLKWPAFTSAILTKTDVILTFFDVA